MHQSVEIVLALGSNLVCSAKVKCIIPSHETDRSFQGNRSHNIWRAVKELSAHGINVKSKMHKLFVGVIEILFYTEGSPTQLSLRDNSCVRC
jgi:hypothetical protein